MTHNRIFVIIVEYQKYDTHALIHGSWAHYDDENETTYPDHPEKKLFVNMKGTILLEHLPDCNPTEIESWILPAEYVMNPMDI